MEKSTHPIHRLLQNTLGARTKSEFFSQSTLYIYMLSWKIPSLTRLFRPTSFKASINFLILEIKVDIVDIAEMISDDGEETTRT